MVLQLLDPYGELRRIDKAMDRVWRGFVDYGRNTEAWSIPLDVEQDGDTLVVTASLPGAKPEDIKVTIEDGVLAIRAQTAVKTERKEGGYLRKERRAGLFHRALRLPDTVDQESVDSRYENGVLRIALPRVEAKKAKQIEVKAA